MRTIAIVNQKGGVGKTTTAVNLAAALAAQHARVGVLDLDAQGHASLHFGVSETTTAKTTYDLLTGQAELAEVWQPTGSNVQVAAASLDLAGLDIELAQVPQRHRRLADQLATATRDFDFLLLDCPPSLGMASLNALVAADEVVLPLQPHFLALDGLSKLLDTLRLVRERFNPKLRLTGIVCCLFDRQTRLAREVAANVEGFLSTAASDGDSPWQGARLFSTRIRRNIRLAEAPSFGQSILDYAPSSPGAVDYRALACELQSVASPSLPAAA